MAQYILKSALVAEIKRRRNFDKELKLYSRVDECNGILSFIDTLEVKRMDFENEQRMKECPYRQVGCTMYEGHILECKGACSWVVDYLKLKEFKAQKEE